MSDQAATSTSPRRLFFNRYKGDRLPPNSRLVTRPGRWGNPFPVKDDKREKAVEAYRVWIFAPEQDALRKRARTELRGMNLACACPLDGRPCHAEVLLSNASPSTPCQAPLVP